MESRRYVITVRGRLSQRFAASFEGLTLEAGDGVTTLSGLFHDQAQLYGVLERVADCGLELAGVQEQDAYQSHPARPTPPATNGREPEMLTKPDDIGTSTRPRTGLRQLIARHPLVTFFVLCYALSWALWIPLAVLRDAIPWPANSLAILVGSNVPSGVAIILTAVMRGKAGTRQLLGRLLIWRVRPWWYLMLLAPTALVLISITGVAVLFGGPTAALSGSVVAAVITVAFMTFPGSALGEEIGWRGFALPRLQYRRTALTASLILATLHALWHLPLWLRGLADEPLSLYPAFVIQVIAIAVIYTWLYNGTKGSLLLAVLFHAALNAPLTLVMLPLGPQDVVLPFWVLSGLSVIAAIIVVAVFGPSQLSRRHRIQEPPEIIAEPVADQAQTARDDGATA